MASKWRQNVYDLIGTTRTNWPLADTPFVNLTYLCARANTPINFGGKVWTHVLKCLNFGSGYQACLARFHGGLNVLSDCKVYGTMPGSFPYGFAVESDRP